MHLPLSHLKFAKSWSPIMKRLITLWGRVSRPVLWALLRTKSEVVRGQANPAPRSGSALLREHELVRSGICKQLSSSQRGSQLSMCHRCKIDPSPFMNGISLSELLSHEYEWDMHLWNYLSGSELSLLTVGVPIRQEILHHPLTPDPKTGGSSEYSFVPIRNAATDVWTPHWGVFDRYKKKYKSFCHDDWIKKSKWTSMLQVDPMYSMDQLRVR